MHDISSALPSILFLLTCDSFERVYRKEIEQNEHSNQKTDNQKKKKSSSLAATKLFGKIMDSLGVGIAS